MAKYKLLIKISAILTVLAMLGFDIAWAYPLQDLQTSSCKLATQSIFKALRDKDVEVTADIEAEITFAAVSALRGIDVARSMSRWKWSIDGTEKGRAVKAIRILKAEKVAAEEGDQGVVEFSVNDRQGAARLFRATYKGPAPNRLKDRALIENALAGELLIEELLPDAALAPRESPEPDAARPDGAGNTPPRSSSSGREVHPAEGLPAGPSMSEGEGEGHRDDKRLRHEERALLMALSVSSEAFVPIYVALAGRGEEVGLKEYAAFFKSAPVYLRSELRRALEERSAAIAEQGEDGDRNYIQDIMAKLGDVAEYDSRERARQAANVASESHKKADEDEKVRAAPATALGRTYVAMVNDGQEVDLAELEAMLEDPDAYNRAAAVIALGSVYTAMIDNGRDVRLADLAGVRSMWMDGDDSFFRRRDLDMNTLRHLLRSKFLPHTRVVKRLGRERDQLDTMPDEDLLAALNDLMRMPDLYKIGEGLFVYLDTDSRELLARARGIGDALTDRELLQLNRALLQEWYRDTVLKGSHGAPSVVRAAVATALETSCAALANRNREGDLKDLAQFLDTAPIDLCRAVIGGVEKGYVARVDRGQEVDCTVLEELLKDAYGHLRRAVATALGNVYAAMITRGALSVSDRFLPYLFAMENDQFGHLGSSLFFSGSGSRALTADAIFSDPDSIFDRYAVANLDPRALNRFDVEPLTADRAIRAFLRNSLEPVMIQTSGLILGYAGTRGILHGLIPSGQLSYVGGELKRECVREDAEALLKTFGLDAGGRGEELLEKNGFRYFTPHDGPYSGRTLIIPIVFDSLLSAYRGSLENDHVQANHFSHDIAVAIGFALDGGDAAKSDGTAGQVAYGRNALHELDLGRMRLEGRDQRDQEHEGDYIELTFRCSPMLGYDFKRTILLFDDTYARTITRLMEWQLNERRAKQNILNIFGWLEAGAVDTAALPRAVDRLRQEVKALRTTCHLRDDYKEAVFGYLDDRFFEELAPALRQDPSRQTLVAELTKALHRHPEVTSIPPRNGASTVRVQHPWIEKNLTLLDYLENERDIRAGTFDEIDVSTVNLEDLNEPSAHPIASPGDEGPGASKKGDPRISSRGVNTPDNRATRIRSERIEASADIGYATLEFYVSRIKERLERIRTDPLTRSGYDPEALLKEERSLERALTQARRRTGEVRDRMKGDGSTMALVKALRETPGCVVARADLPSDEQELLKLALEDLETEADGLEGGEKILFVRRKSWAASLLLMERYHGVHWGYWTEDGYANQIGVALEPREGKRNYPLWKWQWVYTIVHEVMHIQDDREGRSRPRALYEVALHSVLNEATTDLRAVEHLISRLPKRWEFQRLLTKEGFVGPILPSEQPLWRERIMAAGGYQNEKKLLKVLDDINQDSPEAIRRFVHSGDSGPIRNILGEKAWHYIARMVRETWSHNRNDLARHIGWNLSLYMAEKIAASVRETGAVDPDTMRKLRLVGRIYTANSWARLEEAEDAEPTLSPLELKAKADVFSRICLDMIEQDPQLTLLEMERRLVELSDSGEVEARLREASEEVLLSESTSSGDAAEAPDQGRRASTSGAEPGFEIIERYLDGLEKALTRHRSGRTLIETGAIDPEQFCTEEIRLEGALAEARKRTARLRKHMATGSMTSLFQALREAPGCTIARGKLPDDVQLLVKEVMEELGTDAEDLEGGDRILFIRSRSWALDLLGLRNIANGGGFHQQCEPAENNATQIGVVLPPRGPKRNLLSWEWDRVRVIVHEVMHKRYDDERRLERRNVVEHRLRISLREAMTELRTAEHLISLCTRDENMLMRLWAPFPYGQYLTGRQRTDPAIEEKVMTSASYKNEIRLLKLLRGIDARCSAALEHFVREGDSGPMREILGPQAWRSLVLLTNTMSTEREMCDDRYGRSFLWRIYFYAVEKLADAFHANGSVDEETLKLFEACQVVFNASPWTIVEDDGKKGRLYPLVMEARCQALTTICIEMIEETPTITAEDVQAHLGRLLLTRELEEKVLLAQADLLDGRGSSSGVDTSRDASIEAARGGGAVRQSLDGARDVSRGGELAEPFASSPVHRLNRHTSEPANQLTDVSRGSSTGTDETDASAGAEPFLRALFGAYAKVCREHPGEKILIAADLSGLPNDVQYKQATQKVAKALRAIADKDGVNGNIIVMDDAKGEGFLGRVTTKMRDERVPRANVVLLARSDVYDHEMEKAAYEELAKPDGERPGACIAVADMREILEAAKTDTAAYTCYDLRIIEMLALAVRQAFKGEAASTPEIEVKLDSNSRIIRLIPHARRLNPQELIDRARRQSEFINTQA